jgi:SsrA-binding protein
MEKLITQNKQAKRNYALEAEFEAGLVLMGSEVKSLRAGQASLDEAYVRYYKDEVWLVGAHIAPYENAHRTGHESKRERKCLLKRSEIDKIAIRVVERGYSLVPMKLYWKGARVKLLFGLGKGKKLFDKRKDLAARSAQRDVERELKRY